MVLGALGCGMWGMCRLTAAVPAALAQEAYAEAEAELFGGGAKKGKKRKSAGAEEQVGGGPCVAEPPGAGR